MTSSRLRFSLRSCLPFLLLVLAALAACTDDDDRDDDLGVDGGVAFDPSFDCGLDSDSSGDGDAMSPDAPVVDPATLGQPCDGDGDVCPAGTTCVTYYGIAGSAGPEFKSCEITCARDKDVCPEATTCVTIFDGPGAVCRAK